MGEVGGHDAIDPLLEECPGGGKVRRCWWRLWKIVVWIYNSHEKGNVYGKQEEKLVVGLEEAAGQARWLDDATVVVAS